MLMFAKRQEQTLNFYLFLARTTEDGVPLTKKLISVKTKIRMHMGILIS